MVNTNEIMLDIYFNRNCKDPHTVFAQESGMERQEAKIYFYKHMHQQPFWRTALYANSP